MKKKNTLRGAVCALSAGLCWGFSGSVGQFLFAAHDVDSSWLSVVRMFGAGALLLAVAFVRSREQIRALFSNRRDTLRLVAFSVLGLAPCQFTYLTAIRYSNSGTATALQYLGQGLILAWVCLRARRLPTLREAAAVLLALGGVFLLATHGSFGTLVLSPQALLWGLLAAVALMLYTLLPGDLLARYSSIVCVGCGMCIGGIVMFFLVRAWTLHAPTDALALLGVAEIAVVGTAMAFSLYLQGVSDLGGVKGSLLACLEPVSAVLFAALWLKTKFCAEDLIGIALIVIMAILLALPEGQREKREI